MNDAATLFWTWFSGFASRIQGEYVPESWLDELLGQLQRFDTRLYFLLSNGDLPRELIITADGNKHAFPAAEALVEAAPDLEDWRFIALKPAMGFQFRHTDGPVKLDVSQLWFMPRVSVDDPSSLEIVLAVPDADFVLAQQSVDTAFTILETAIGERSCATDIAEVTVDDIPENPRDHGYLRLPLLPEFIATHKRQN